MYLYCISIKEIKLQLNFKKYCMYWWYTLYQLVKKVLADFKKSYKKKLRSYRHAEKCLIRF